MDKQPDMQAWARESVRAFIARAVQGLVLQHERLALIRERQARRSLDAAERIKRLGK